MTWTLDHKNQQKKNGGSGITPSYFPAPHEHDHFWPAETKDRTDYKLDFYLEGFKV